jgi:hypothetical protein
MKGRECLDYSNARRLCQETTVHGSPFFGGKRGAGATSPAGARGVLAPIIPWKDGDPCASLLVGQGVLVVLMGDLFESIYIL